MCTVKTSPTSAKKRGGGEGLGGLAGSGGSGGSGGSEGRMPT